MPTHAHDLTALLIDSGHPIEIMRADRVGYILLASGSTVRVVWFPSRSVLPKATS